MANQNVRFYFGTQAKYDALVEKNPVALYFIEDTQRLYKGAKLLAVGTEATALASGLMSAADKAKLDALTVGGVNGLTAIDATITLTDAEDGGKIIGVAVSAQENNALVVAEDGLFVPQTSVKVAEESHGLVSVDGTLSINLATTESDGAMSKEDKAFIANIPTVYATKELVKATAEQVKYEISNKPVGTLVNYKDSEIRVMCPADIQWTLQNSGEGSDPNSYYIGFKAYAPDDAVNFKEDLAEIIADETMYAFEGNDFAGVDEFGRKYSIVWLPVAKHDSSTGTWTYHGDNSSAEKYVGWDYSVEWYNADGIVVAADTIRINLSNEDCHNSIQPYYMNNYATVEHVTKLEENIVWAEITEY